MNVPTPEEAQEAALYALIHRGHRGDTAYYGKACKGAAAVLELGCGYGRLLPSLSRVARRVTGIEAHAGLLAMAEAKRLSLPKATAKRVTLCPGDVTLALPEGPFDRIVWPYNGLFCLANREEKLAALRHAREVSTDEACLLFDVYVLDVDTEEAVIEDDFDYLISVLDEAGRLDVYEQNVESPGNVITANYRFERLGDVPTPPLQSSVRHHYLRPAALKPLLLESGWCLDEVYEDFRCTPTGDDPVLFVARARPQRSRVFSGPRKSPLPISTPPARKRP